jgi:hypothetical protein
VDKDIEDFCGPSIVTASLKREFTGESQTVIVQIREPKGIKEAFEEELEKLANVLINGNS